MSAPALAEQPERQPSVKIREACERCKRMATKHSRKAYTWRCTHCGFVNIGPGYREQDKTPPEGTRRRVARRERAAEQRAEQGAAVPPSGPSPAPVRRKRTLGAGAQATRPAATEPAEGAPPPSPRSVPATPRRGLFDRIFYGEEE